MTPDADQIQSLNAQIEKANAQADLWKKAYLDAASKLWQTGRELREARQAKTPIPGCFLCRLGARLRSWVRKLKPWIVYFCIQLSE